VGEDPFAGKADWFDRGYTETSHGRARLEIVLERILAALPEPPLRVLDAGGGTGAFAIPLARRGDDVTVLDQSEEWLGVAERRAGEAAVNLRLVRGDVEDAPGLVAGPFDAILCHTVLIYAEDPVRSLQALREVAAPGALLSSLEKNRPGLPLRPARAWDFDEALRVLTDPVAAGRLGIPNRALTLGELRAALLRAGWVATDAAGIRVFSDGVLEALPEERHQVLLELDRRAGRRDPWRRVARLLHVLARAVPEEPETLGAVQTRSRATASPATREAFPVEQTLDDDDLAIVLGRRRYLTLATTRPDGRPHAAMVGFCVRDGRFWIPSTGGSARLRNLAHEPAVSLVVSEGEGPDHVVVLVEGEAVVHADPGPVLRDWLADAWRDRHGTDPTSWTAAMIEVLPTKVLSFGRDHLHAPSG
jgi:SAM-dependent methyltransferase